MQILAGRQRSPIAMLTGFLKVVLSKHSREVTINNRIKAINNCESHIENFIFVTAVLKQKDLETSLSDFEIFFFKI